MQLIYREKINNNILANNAFILKKYSLYISIIIFTVIEYVIKCNYIISFIFVLQRLYARRMIVRHTYTKNKQ